MTDLFDERHDMLYVMLQVDTICAICRDNGINSVDEFRDYMENYKRLQSEVKRLRRELERKNAFIKVFGG